MGQKYNWEIERSLLGGLMLDGTQLTTTRELLVAADFHRPQHGALFELLAALSERGKAADVATVMDDIGQRDAFEAYGGAAYVAALPNACPSVENVSDYAERVRAHSVRRRLSMACLAVHAEVRAGELGLIEQLDSAESQIFAVTRLAPVTALHVASELVDQELRVLQALYANPGAVTGIPTRFVDLDRMLAGLQPSDLIILAARPAMGKTAFAMQLAMEAARAGHATGVFSLEMSRGQLTRRMLSSESRTDASRMRTGRLDVDDWRRISEAAERIYDLPIVVGDTPGLTIMQLRAKARLMRSRFPSLGLIVVDYLQLMSGPGGTRETREQAIAGIARGLKVLAKELNIPVVALSQLSRAVESRTDKRPIPSDLRESGAIEQDADVILFLYRDEYYDPNSADKGLAEVIVAKQRNGPTGTVKLAFLGQYTMFQNYAPMGDGDGYL